MNSRFGIYYLAYGFYSPKGGNRKKPKYLLLGTKEKPIETKKPKGKGKNRKAQPPPNAGFHPFGTGQKSPIGYFPANVKECRTENGAENVTHGLQTAVKAVKKRPFWLLIINSYQNHSPFFAPFSYLPGSFMVVQNRILRAVFGELIEQNPLAGHFSGAGNGEGKINSGDCSNLKKRWWNR